MIRSTVAVIVVVGLAAGLLASDGSPTAAPVRSSNATDSVTPPRRPVSASFVVSDLIREGSKTWYKDHTWPRSTADYAVHRNLSLPNSQVLVLLTRKTHQNPSIAAYVKWQLLSFEPDFSKATETQFRQMIALMPDVRRQPAPVARGAAVVGRQGRGGGGGGGMNLFIGRQQAFIRDLIPFVANGVVAYKPVIGVVNSGTSLSTQGTVSADGKYATMTIQFQNAQVAEFRKVVARANEPVINFRNQMINQLPAGNGVQMAAMIQDIHDRLDAGDPSHVQAVDRALQAVELHDWSKNETVQRRLVASARKLAAIRTPVLEAVNEDDRGQASDEIDQVRMSREQWRQLMTQLAQQ